MLLISRGHVICDLFLVSDVKSYELVLWPLGVVVGCGLFYVF